MAVQVLYLPPSEELNWAWLKTIFFILCISRSSGAFKRGKTSLSGSVGRHISRVRGRRYRVFVKAQGMGASMNASTGKEQCPISSLSPLRDGLSVLPEMQNVTLQA
jgi:hypothetical protein